MALNDIYQVVCRFTLHGQTCLNILHYQETVSAGALGQQQLAIVADDEVLAGYRVNCSAEMTYNDVTVQRVTGGAIPTATVVATNTGLCAVAGECLPISDTVVLTKRTGLAGPRYRGRVFVPGIPISYELNSKLGAAGTAAMTALATVLSNNRTIAGYTFQPVLFHRDTKSGNNITAVEPQPVLRAQRRRQIGKGI